MSRTSKKKPAARSRKSSKKAPSTGNRPHLRNIARQEKTAKRAAGWTVSLTRRGENMYRSFADSKYGGKTKALLAAKDWREEIVESTTDADYVLWRRKKRSRPSTTGIVGVGRYAVLYGTTRHLVWEAYWQDADGKRYSRRFFVSVHGERGAKAHATAARREGIAELRQELVRRGEAFK